VADPLIKDLAYQALAYSLGSTPPVEVVERRPTQAEIDAFEREQAGIPSPMDAFTQAASMGQARPVQTTERILSRERMPGAAVGGTGIEFTAQAPTLQYPEALRSVMQQSEAIDPFAYSQDIARRFRESPTALTALEATGLPGTLLGNVAGSMATRAGAPPSVAAGIDVLTQTGILPVAAARAVPRIGQEIARQFETGEGIIGAMSMRPRLNAVPEQSPIEQSRQIAQRSPIGFYSAVEETVTKIPQNKGTGDQFLAQIQKTAGVKPEEIQWTGLDEFLKGKKSVTKQEIQDYLASNRVDVQEVQLGTQPTRFEGNTLFVDNQIVGSINDTSAGYAFRTPDGKYDFLNVNRMDQAVEKVKERLGIDIPETRPTKFSQYALPGGENYREILLTLPAKEPRNLNDIAMEKFGKRFSDLGDSEANQVVLAEKSEIKAQNFRSSHFDQPNILAHMRVNDRVIDGKKTLFIEEVQSDWHQAGRKKGYDTPEAKAAEQKKLDDIVDERQRLFDEQRRLEELALPYTSQGRDAPADIVDAWSIVSNRLNNLQNEQNRLGRTFGQQVPNAPFKTTWHDLALKRAIQEASEKGYDRIAFTTGKTQADRYDLSKQIDELIVEKTPNGEFNLKATVPNGGGIQPIQNNVTADELENIVGKDLASSITKQDYGTEVYSGGDLRVGGEGMKGFYDNILPKSLDKLGKKFDAKIGKTEMDGVEVWVMDITPKMRQSAKEKGQPLFQIAPPIAAGAIAEDENNVE